MPKVEVDITPVPVTRSSTYAERETRSDVDVVYEAPQRPPLKWTRQLTADRVVFSVFDSATGTYGAGGDPRKALEDLSSAMKEHREVLEGQEKLSPPLQEQLRRLRRQ